MRSSILVLLASVCSCATQAERAASTFGERFAGNSLLDEILLLHHTDRRDSIMSSVARSGVVRAKVNHRGEVERQLARAMTDQNRWEMNAFVVLRSRHSLPPVLLVVTLQPKPARDFRLEAKRAR